MQIINQGILLLGLVFNIVLLVFIVISVLLIYYLLMIDVETKTLENGIMRILGTNKKSLIMMVAVQSCMFVFPAILIAFALSFGMIALCYKYIFEEDLDNGFEPVPSSSAMIKAIILGLIIPLLSSILPILSVLSQNLNDALNFQKSRMKGTFVEIMKKRNVNNVPYILFGFITLIYGFGVFYILPLSFLSMDIGLILVVFFIILMGLILGLTLLALNLQRVVESALIYLLLFWEKTSMLKMLFNNLKAH